MRVFLFGVALAMLHMGAHAAEMQPLEASLVTQVPFKTAVVCVSNFRPLLRIPAVVTFLDEAVISYRISTLFGSPIFDPVFEVRVNDDGQQRILNFGFKKPESEKTALDFTQKLIDKCFRDDVLKLSITPQGSQSRP